MMQPSLVILCLFLFVSGYAAVQEDGAHSPPSAAMTACPETLPVVENGEVSPTSLKNNYTEGDKLVYICQHGYVSLGRIIYICNKNQWVNPRNVKCSRKRCELPADIPNGRYIIVNGTNFVFGTTIKYICKEGYQMVSRVDTRTCLAAGWNNLLPQCEEFSCLPPETGDNVTVDGLPDHGETLTYGQRIQFTCDSPDLKLVGPKEATCQENGEWSPLPRCEEVTCELEEVGSRVTVIGVPKGNGPMKYGHKLWFYCSNSEMALTGRNEITCSTGGAWSSPFPTCEEVTCKEGQLNNVRIVRGFSDTSPPYKPKHRLHFQCIESDMVMMGQPSLTCRSDGTWNSPFPTCFVYGACGPPPTIQNAKTTTTPKHLYRRWERVTYTCYDYTTMHGNPYAICQEGAWVMNFQCLRDCTVKKEDMDDNKIQWIESYYPQETLHVRHGDYTSFGCQNGRRPKNDGMYFYPTCYNGVIHLPTCQ